MNIQVPHKNKIFIPLVISFLSLICANTCTVNIEVTSEADSGLGTLRQAILDATDNDFIYFSPAVKLIQLQTPLPLITANNITITAIGSVVDGKPVPGDCSLLPSPVDNPEEFATGIPVTIDGSKIPLTNNSDQIGLFFDNSGASLVQGIHIKNFFGKELAPQAVGITAANETSLTVECCMINTIECANDQQNTSFAIGINNAATISKCYIKNITSLSLNHAASPDVAQTAPAFGIFNSRQIDDSRIECINSGDILTERNGTLTIDTLTIGAAKGIEYQNFFKTSHPSKACVAVDPRQEISVKNSLIAHIHGGSITSSSNIQEIHLDTVSGIYFDNEINSTIENCTICDVQIGTTSIDDANTTELLRTNGLFGIFANANTSSSCIQNNTIKSILHGSSKTNTEELITNLTMPIGISAEAQPLVIENNNVTSIFGGYHVTGGANSITKSRSTSVTNDIRIGSSGIVATQAFFSSQKRTNKNKATPCPTPESSSDPVIIVCNNTISSVSGSTLKAAGDNSLITSSGSVGIASSSGSKISITNNNVHKVYGPSLLAAGTNSNSILDFGSKGIIISTPKEHHISYNSISSIQEGTITTVPSSSHENYEKFNFSNEATSSDISLSGSNAPAQTVGITSQLFGFAEIVTKAEINTYAIEQNQVEAITGSHPSGLGRSSAGIGIGIQTTAPTPLNTDDPGSELMTKQCTSITTPITISRNSVYNINSHKTRPAYGIFSEQLFDTQSLFVEHNTITSVSGGGAALLEEQQGGSQKHIVLPSILPYEPTSGIYFLDVNCSNILNNTIKTIRAPENQARGITTTASSDVEIIGNSLSQIKGVGIFVGGAPVPIGSEMPIELDVITASIQNVIHTNATFDNTKKGIELGISNWENAYIFFEFFEGINPIDTNTIIGNHNQVAPRIKNVLCNSNGTTTIDIDFYDQSHPNSIFIIQFFRNNTDIVPHGRQAITPFSNEFEFTTDENGIARIRFVFTPAHKINSNDSISAHATIIADGSNDVGDTSEFAVQHLNKQSQLGCIASSNKISKERSTNLHNLLFARR